jgi:hypothetical protein
LPAAAEREGSALWVGTHDDVHAARHFVRPLVTVPPACSIRSLAASIEGTLK